MSSARQQDNEPLAEYYKRFTSCVDVLGESQWGTPVTTAAATNETDEKTSRNKFITCVFLQEWIPKRYRELKLPKDGRECHDNVVTLYERQGSSYDR
jgi:hypothetical protein